MAVAWSDDGKEVIKRQVDVNIVDTYDDNQDVEVVFEVERCVAWIKEKQLKEPTLQFPDSLLKFAPDVSLAIERGTGLNRVSILGDTSYGECCVDEVAAEHIGADGVIHFGNTCLTPTVRLPVLYVYTILPVDVANLKSCLDEKFPPEDNAHIALFYDLPYHDALKDFSDSRVFTCRPRGEDATVEEEEEVRVGRICPADVNSEKWTLVHVGSNTCFTVLLALTFGKCKQLLCFDGKRLFDSGINISKSLRRRYFMVEKARDAQRIGILVGTLGAARYGNVIDQVRSRIKAAGKKPYTFLVGKPNVPKLANFPEIDVYVLVACPENSVMDSRDFFRPIITPFELDVALNSGCEWTGEFFANFHEILPGGRQFREFEADANTDVSLISGKIRTVVNVADGKNSAEDRALLPQEMRVGIVHENGGGEFLSRRRWQGLEQKLGETPVAVAKEGTAGLAWSYDGEGKS